MITIRDLAPLEIREAAAVMVQPRTPWHRYGLGTSDAVSILHAGLTEGARILVASDGEHVVGWVWFERKGTFYHAGYIRIVVVSDAYPRKGIGTALMNAAEQDIFSFTKNIFLLVSEWNQPARDFYELRGYREIGRLQDYVSVGNTELICWKSAGPIYLTEAAPAL
jgi:ribosomal protein S18 acetylase RimI-like enzyme